MLLARLGVIALIICSLAGFGVPADAGPAPSRPSSGVDRSLDARDCHLLGRRYVAGHGCSRTACVRGAIPYNRGQDAEECALPHQGDHAYGAAVDFRRCGALHRRWIPEVNWCAANPNRSARVIEHAPQCTGRHTTYVTLTDVEPAYDICLTPASARRLERSAHRTGHTLGHEVSRRSPTLCSFRPGHAFVGNACVRTSSAQEPPGTLLIGDSIAWRGTDELARAHPDFTLDGYPGRRFRDLAGRLAWYRAGHGEPTGLILELGTNASAHFGRSDLAGIVGSLPASTEVMLVLPYRAQPGRGIARWTTRYTGWMEQVARMRPTTCLADWRAFVARRPRVLVDGVHPTHAGEATWARWISREWSACTGSAASSHVGSPRGK